MFRNTKLIVSMLLALTLLVGVNANARETYQTTNLIDFTDGSVELGAATLRRTEDELWVNINGVMDDGDAGYTVWWVIFNRPDQCAANPCGLGDLGNAAVKATVYYATGFVTGTDPMANVSMHTSAQGPAEGPVKGIRTGQIAGSAFIH